MVTGGGVVGGVGLDFATSIVNLPQSRVGLSDSVGWGPGTVEFRGVFGLPLKWRSSLSSLLSSRPSRFQFGNISTGQPTVDYRVGSTNSNNNRR